SLQLHLLCGSSSVVTTAFSAVGPSLSLQQRCDLLSLYVLPGPTSLSVVLSPQEIVFFATLLKEERTSNVCWAHSAAAVGTSWAERWNRLAFSRGTSPCTEDEC
ncbi:unnamed protein product, partial [Ectocarpus sp. 12 AP-2014]